MFNQFKILHVRLNFWNLETQFLDLRSKELHPACFENCTENTLEILKLLREKEDCCVGHCSKRQHCSSLFKQKQQLTNPWHLDTKTNAYLNMSRSVKICNLILFRVARTATFPAIFDTFADKCDTWRRVSMAPMKSLLLNERSCCLAKGYYDILLRSPVNNLFMRVSTLSIRMNFCVRLSLTSGSHAAG